MFHQNQSLAKPEGVRQVARFDESGRTHEVHESREGEEDIRGSEETGMSGM